MQAPQLTANEIHGTERIGLFWLPLHWGFLFWHGEMKREIQLRELYSTKSEIYFCPNYWAVAVCVFYQTHGREAKHRLVFVLPRWALDHFNIKPSHFKALCRHQREFPTRCLWNTQCPSVILSNITIKRRSVYYKYILHSWNTSRSAWRSSSVNTSFVFLCGSQFTHWIFMVSL